MEPRAIADYACVTGEGPLWHPMEKRVYWVDIPNGRLFRHTPAKGTSQAFDVGAAVGGFTIQEDGALLLFMARGAVKLWRAGRLQTLIDELPEEADNRFNDVIADPEGRVFCGVMSTKTRAGRLYRLDPDGRVTLLLEGIGTSNGMGFTPDGKGMYYTDTRAREIYRFDYDRSTGAISNQRVFVRVPDEEGGPDGMTVDAEGRVWSAQWGGYQLVCYSPDGAVLRRIAFPTRKVSCVTFGGDDWTDMYVTTAGGNTRDEDGALAGALFHLNLGVRGVPEFFSKIRA